MTHTKFLFMNNVGNGAVETHVFNFPKLMSSINRKAYHNVDTKGNAQNYMIGMKLYGVNATALTLVAPNTYYVRRAVKAWHDARMKMYRRAGISMKSLRYARNLRPYLNVNHENGSTVEIDTENSTALGISPSWIGDEWTYSRAAVATPGEADSSQSVQHRDLVDTYSFTLLDASVTEDATADDPDESSTSSDQDSYVSVGMIDEWLDSFKRKALATGANTIIDADNALLQLVSQQGSDKEEVLELAEDAQKEGRPWDSTTSDGVAQYTSGVQGSWCRSTTGESSYAVVTAPCGLLQLSIENSHTSSDDIRVEFEVLDISDM
uniref:Uncharacterized protein n=1 Tax=uncultured marine virus TaxID=186617 RepID=S4TFB8_9VIRU|nr:hypothetical protein [uncultured marine virus]